MEKSADLSLSGGDFGFAFNNVTFSDRLLRIEITCAGSQTSGSTTNVDWVKDRKRRREDSQNHPHVATCHVESDLNKNWCETDDEMNKSKHEEMNKSKHEETMVISTEQGSGGEDKTEYYNWGQINHASILRVKELHINSAILAAKSPFFYKLFSNGMLESEQKHMTLKIDVSEEAAVMELLYFMYSNSLTSTTASALLDVLIAADKFEVASCMKHCSRLLLNMPMTLESALLFLGLPSSLLVADSVKPLTSAARQFIASRYKDMTKSRLLEEVMALPLVGIEALLASDDLQISSEDYLYEVVLKWAKTHYSVVEERQEILGSHLARYIRFHHMTCHRLKTILTSNDFKPSVAAKLVIEALFFKAEPLDHRRVLAPEQPASINHSFLGRSYKFRPIKIVEFDAPRHGCIVYVDLKRKECEGLYPSNRIISQKFHLGGQGFYLSAQCNMDQLNVFHCFGLFLGTEDNGPVCLTVDYNFSARSMPTEEFAVNFKGNYMFTSGKAVGCRNVFSRTWHMFIAKDCPYFINDVLHLRVELSLRL